MGSENGQNETKWPKWTKWDNSAKDQKVVIWRIMLQIGTESILLL